MAETILFTDVGEGIHEGKLVQWRVAEGEAIKEDQPLCEIETDKAVVEIPSSKTGTVLKLHASVGQIMHVGDSLVTVGQPGESIPAVTASAVSSGHPSSPAAPVTTSSSPTVPVSKPPVSAPTSASLSATSAPKATPAVRKLAQQLGVDLNRVNGSGPGGLVTESDVQSAKSSASKDAQGASSELPASSSQYRQAAAGPSIHPALIKAAPSVRKLAFELGVDLGRVQGSGTGGRITEDDVRNANAPQSTAMSASAPTAASVPASPVSVSVPAPSAATRRIHVVSRPYGTEIRKPFTPVRKIISERLSWSAALPTVTHVDEADVTELWKIREKEKVHADEKGVKLTLLPFVVKAVCKALQEFPDFNASLDDEKGEVVLKKYYDVGIAVDTPIGLMVPVLKDADKKSVFDIAQQVQLLATKAKERSLKADELSGSTFTITNIGSAGGIYATPLINPPEAAILGVMRMQTRPAFAPAKKNATDSKAKPSKSAPKVEARQFLPLCLTFDHRLNDGAAAALFVMEVKKHLENPEGLLVGDI
ncbi:2-oxo acid dehydrogenase subunit E2 [Candidatus Micrarchaeota archaeon]|nr:2-oxo acid dehydrogenase subunit E2 [Candidatus Micrarchaeota archaeon]